MTPAEDVLMSAIARYLAPSWDQRDTYGDAAYHYACTEVQVAIAALQGRHWDPAAVAEFTALLTGHPAPAAVFVPACQSCGGTTGLDAVHRPAAYGLAERVEHYCHDATACHHRRHTTAISGIAS